MQALRAFRHGLDVFLRWFCIILFAVLVLLVVWQVFVRQVLNSGNAWTEAAARITFVWQGLIGAAYVIGEKDDVAIDWLVRKFPSAVVKGAEVLAHAIVGFFGAWVMVYGGYQIVSATWDDAVELMPVTQGFLYSAVPIAGLLIVLYSIIHIIEAVVAPPKEVVAEEDIDISTLQEEGI